MRTEPTEAVDTRHWPWLTWGLLLTCVVSLAYTHSLESKIRANAGAGVDRAIEYFEEQANLREPAILAQSVGGTEVDELRSAFQSDRGPRPLTPIEQAMARRHQQTLDDLVVEALAPFEKLPKYHLGLRASERRPMSWVTYPMIHHGWMDLLGNGLLLLMLGTYMERIWRAPLFGAFLITSALASGAVFAFARPELTDPLIGLGGIVAGLLGAYGARYASMWRDPRYGLLLAVGVGWPVVPGILEERQGLEALLAQLGGRPGAAAVRIVSSCRNGSDDMRGGLS